MQQANEAKEIHSLQFSFSDQLSSIMQEIDIFAVPK